MWYLLTKHKITPTSKNTDSKNDPIISYEHVSKYTSTKKAILRDINITIHRGEFVYIIGESGAGKTTLFKSLYGAINLSTGKATVLNQNLINIHENKLPNLRKKIGIVFQDFQLFSEKTISENVAYALEIFNYPKRKIRRRVSEVLDIVNLTHVANRYPHQISGGEQQRASFARALANNPEIIIADEPTGNLDPTMTESLAETLELINSLGTTIIIATHDINLVNNYRHRVIELSNGSIDRDDVDSYYNLNQLELSANVESEDAYV